MAKLCPKGKAAAKRKFKVYPSAYANMYASKVCKGKVRSSAKDGGFMSRPSKAKDRFAPKKSYTKEDGKYYDTKGRELNVGFNKGKTNRKPRISLKKNRSRPTKFREGGMVIENMTRTIEV
jgi:hypothetical protein